MKTYLLTTLVLFLALTTLSRADEQKQPETVKVGTWQVGIGLGFGEMKSPLTDRDDISLYALPDIRYFGERLTVENTTISYSLIETPTYSFQLISDLNTDGLFFPNDFRSAIATVSPSVQVSYDPDPSYTPETEHTIYPTEKSFSYMVGGAWRYYGAVNINLAATKDATAGHHGNEYHATITKQFRYGDLFVEGKIGLTHKSANLVDYYYSRDASDLHFELKHLSYTASSATNWHSQIQLAYPLFDDWWLVGLYRYEALDSEIYRSPIVQKDNVQSYFLGIKRVFEW